jgi:cytochrome P450
MQEPVQFLTLHDVPGGVLLVGHLRLFKKSPLNMMSAWSRQHGDALRFRLGLKNIYLVSHPALAEEILVQQSERLVKAYEHRPPVGLALVLGNGLVTSSGDAWKRHRRHMQRSFTQRVAEDRRK